ncbi:MAG: cysteine desulfurase [Ardenticatenia bacterium]|nr:MAG: cysteine desulfurase [Ardenticatenia bacterium]
MLDSDVVRQDFPILHQSINGKPLVYLDSAASSQKPLVVIQAMDEYYRAYHANVHRGIYQLSEKATEAYEAARRKVARFINARSWREIIFTRNATEAINLVAYAWGRHNITARDKILVTEMEHHANLVPWQQLAAETGAQLAYIPLDENFCCDMAAYEAMLDAHVKLVAITQMSNVLGTIVPVREFVARAHAVGALVLLDGAQGVPHLPTDVQSLDVDFLAASGHKMLGPTGSGFLYGKRHLLEEMPPFLTGGEMIRRVTWTGAEWNDLPHKFEAGTPAIAEAIGLGVAVDYLSRLGMENVRQHEVNLTRYALEQLSQVEGIRIYGPQQVERRGGAIAFNLDGLHAHDVAAILDREGIAIRAGHHCAMPLHQKLGVVATARASFYVYNEPAEIDRLVEALDMVRRLFER